MKSFLRMVRIVTPRSAYLVATLDAVPTAIDQSRRSPLLTSLLFARKSIYFIIIFFNIFNWHKNVTAASGAVTILQSAATERPTATFDASRIFRLLCSVCHNMWSTNREWHLQPQFIHEFITKIFFTISLGTASKQIARNAIVLNDRLAYQWMNSV